MPRAVPALLHLQLLCSCHPGNYWIFLNPDISFVRPKSHSPAERDPYAVHALAPWSSPFPLTLSGQFALHCCLMFHPTQQSQSIDGSTSKMELNAFHLKC